MNVFFGNRKMPFSDVTQNSVPTGTLIQVDYPGGKIGRKAPETEYYWVAAVSGDGRLFGQKVVDISTIAKAREASPTFEVVV